MRINDSRQSLILDTWRKSVMFLYYFGDEVRRTGELGSVLPCSKGSASSSCVSGSWGPTKRGGVCAIQNTTGRFRVTAGSSSQAFFFCWFWPDSQSVASLKMFYRNGSGTGSLYVHRQSNTIRFNGSTFVTDGLILNQWNLIVVAEQGYSGGTDCYLNGVLKLQTGGVYAASETLDLLNDNFSQTFTDPVCEVGFVASQIAATNPGAGSSSTSAMALYRMGPGAIAKGMNPFRYKNATAFFSEQAAGGGGGFQPAWATAARRGQIIGSGVT